MECMQYRVRLLCQIAGRAGQRRIKGTIAVAISVSLLMLSPLLANAHMADNEHVEGANGVLHFHGTLSEGACRLEMASAYQAISLGDTGTGSLMAIGDRGVPTAFQLRLRDCVRSAGTLRDERTGVLNWDASQPSVSINFIAPADNHNPHLVKVQGISGLGLRITDDEGRDIRLGFRGRPQFLSLGRDTLNYTVTPERTAGPLRAGAYYSQVGLSYN
ncbi:fimbrial protein [Serratia sp. NPDC078593]|uniref:fimbrial protein n=1 Tax=unclassified Serratia (in: enterobacteria) TaxID=2647522 RepID=UPI0037D606A4